MIHAFFFIFLIFFVVDDKPSVGIFRIFDNMRDINDI